MDSYEEYLNHQKNKNKSFFNLFSKIKPIHIIGFAILFFIGNKLYKSENSNLVYYALGALIIIYIISIMKEEQTKKIIPRNIALEIAKKDLENEIGEGKIFPVGTKIIPIVTFKDQFFDSGDGPKIIKFNFGFKIKSYGKPEKYYIYQMNPYTGECKGIIEKNIQFDGEDVKDIQLIFPEKFKEESKPVS